ncbi:hypothetical protein L210DRAFT_3524986 [Boletus edulis BED1]|uniref:Uncharacterized protein n=2 Tax=Boletus edulis BED1 TaxID=1328754 RepID=A0AAD4C782_BOLED|nr:hypothetical protein L210DRAFT_3524986 [Boletus edulis BED1]
MAQWSTSFKTTLTRIMAASWVVITPLVPHRTVPVLLATILAALGKWMLWLRL